MGGSESHHHDAFGCHCEIGRDEDVLYQDPESPPLKTAGCSSAQHVFFHIHLSDY